MTGFSPEGLVIPRQPEIIANLVAEENIYIHPDINTAPDTFLGQRNEVLANQITVIHEYLEACYSQRRLSSAVGRALDEIGLEKNVTRLLSSNSSVDVILEGINDTLVPSNSLVEDQSTKQRYLTQSTKRILNIGCIATTINTTTSAPSTAFTITINGTAYTRSTPGSGVNMTTTLGLLAGDINTAVIGVTASSTASSISLVSPTNTPFDVTTNSSFSWAIVKTKVKAVSLAVGSISAPTPGDWRILSPVPGWNKVSPLMSSASNGRDEELDEDFRIRIRASNDSLGRGTTRAVKTKLRNVPGVLHADVFENTTIVPIGSIDPYSIHCVVDGGDEEDIAQTIWETHGHCHLMGDTSVNYIDEFGVTQLVKFSRPDAIDVDVRVTLVAFEEETLTPDYVNIIKNAVVSFINNIGLGKDIIPSQMYVPIYNSVDGVNVTNIEVKPNGSGSFSNARFTINPSQFAHTVVANVSIA